MSSLAILILAILINITSTGAATVTLVTHPASTLYTNISLPVAAYPSTMYAVNACTGKIVGIVPAKTFVIVPSSEKCLVYVKYIAYVVPTNVTTFRLVINLKNVTVPARVYFAKNIVFIPPTGSEVLPNGTLILRPGKVYTLQYIVLPPVTGGHVKHGAVPSAHTSKPSSSSQSMQHTLVASIQGLSPSAMLYIIAGIAIVAVAIAGAVVAFRRRATRAVAEYRSPFLKLK